MTARFVTKPFLLNDSWVWLNINFHVAKAIEEPERSAPPMHIVHVYTIHYTAPSLDLLVLQLDRLPVYKNTFTLVRFRHPPFPYVGRKLHHHLFFRPLEQQTCWLRCARGNALWNAHFNGVRVSNLEVDKLLAGVLRENGGGGIFD